MPKGVRKSNVSTEGHEKSGSRFTASIKVPVKRMAGSKPSCRICY